MLKYTIATIQRVEEDFNRREALVRTVINAEKQAKTNERIRFLLECKREAVFPKFITNSVRNVSYIITVYHVSVKFAVKTILFVRFFTYLSTLV